MESQAQAPDMSRILQRVRKMMALANDKAASDGERENAMRMAHATLASIVLASFYKTELEANQRYLEEQLKVKLRFTKSREHRAGSGYGEGAEYGSKVSLNRQVGGSSGGGHRRLTHQ